MQAEKVDKKPLKALPPKKKLPPRKPRTIESLAKPKAKEYYKRLKYQFRVPEDNCIVCLQFDPATAVQKKAVAGRGALSAPGRIRVGGRATQEHTFRNVIQTYFGLKPYRTESKQAGAHHGACIWIMGSCSEEKFLSALKTLDAVTTLHPVANFGRLMR